MKKFLVLLIALVVARPDIKDIPRPVIVGEPDFFTIYPYLYRKNKVHEIWYFGEDEESRHGAKARMSRFDIN